MSRHSMAPQRNLSLTEELEKLEQSITLTLQGKQTRDCPTKRD
jgi:DASH complex subunit ASK1